nr:type IV pilin protein [Caldimonas manganoxidans]
MIVVVVVAILAAVAYPSYIEQVRRGHRADAKALLLEAAQFMERNFTESNSYATTSSGASVTLPFSQSPRSGTARYTIAFSAGSPTATSFLIQATPTGSMNGDPCGTLGINQLGQKTKTGGDASRTAADCWDR